LRDAELSLLAAEGPAVAYLRRAGDEGFAVVANAGDEPLLMDLELPFGPGAAQPVPLRGETPGTRSAEVADRSLRVAVPARDGVVVRLS
jgi:hypothetical protein